MFFHSSLKNIIFFGLTVIYILHPVHGDTTSNTTLLSKYQQSQSNQQTFKIKKIIKPYALVIGVGHYQYFPDLPHAVDDAKEIASVLTLGGYEVKLLIDPASIYMKSAFDKLSDVIGKNEDRNILVYYSGHGETQLLDDGNSVGWILPSDCPQLKNDPRNFKSKGMNTKYIETVAREIKSRHVMMLFDSSFSSNTFILEKPALRSLSEKSRQPIRHFIIAGSADEPIPEKSLFKDYLIKGFLGEADTLRDGFVTGSELGVFLVNRISREMDHHQTLQFAKIKDTNLNQGDYIFKVINRPVFGTLAVKTVPKFADIKILNITPKFTQGMKLADGKYKVQVSAKGYTTHTQWVRVGLGKDKSLTIQLNKVRPAIRNSLGMDMVWLDPGKFVMGSQKNELGRIPDEIPHPVFFQKGFRIQRSEVTMGQFGVFVKDTGYKTDAEKGKGCWQFTPGIGWKLESKLYWNALNIISLDQKEKLEDYPVTCVSYKDVTAFIKWLNKKERRTYSLPTEAQWEYACRASTRTPFSYGNCLTVKNANFGNTGFLYNACTSNINKIRLTPLPIKSLKANGWGIYDMHGNIAEWCSDWYGAYKDLPIVKDPKGSATGTERVVRGGHFASSMDLLRSAKRSGFPPDSSARAIGFRLVLGP